VPWHVGHFIDFLFGRVINGWKERNISIKKSKENA
jgi:hypothetical protein